MPRPPFLASVAPCAGAVGQQIRIKGTDFFGTAPTKILVNGVEAEIVSLSGEEAVFIIPMGATSGRVTISHDVGSAESYDDLLIRKGDPVPEIEPNDNIDGSNATQMNGELIATGNLSTAGLFADKDHFKFQCLDETKRIKITVYPRLVSVIYLNGLSAPLDSNGEYTLPAGQKDLLIGLTGAVGTYSIILAEIP